MSLTEQWLKIFKLPLLVVVGLGVVGIIFIAAILGYFKKRSNILPHKEGLTKTRVSALASALYAYGQEHNGLEKPELRGNTVISNAYLFQMLAGKAQGENPHKISLSSRNFGVIKRLIHLMTHGANQLMYSSKKSCWKAGETKYEIVVMSWGEDQLPDGAQIKDDIEVRKTLKVR